MLKKLFILFVVVREAIQQEEPFECGQRPLAEAVNFNDEAETAKPGQWPWYGAVYHRQADRSLRFACGGTLISRKHLLTAGDCVVDGFESLLFVQLGCHNLNVLNLGFAKYRKVRLVHRSGAVGGGADGGLVLLELSSEVKFNKFVQPICLFANALRFIASDPFKWLLLGWDFKKDVGQLGTHSGTNRDSASILVTNYVGIWYMKGIERYSEITVVFMRDHVAWFAEITKLDYLRKTRSGDEYDPAQFYPQLLPQKQCGKSYEYGEERSENAGLFEFPWMVQLYSWINYSEAIPYCAGTLISFRYVVSAISCVLMMYPDFVTLGEYSIDTNPDCDHVDPTDCAPPVRYYEVDYVVRGSSLGGNISKWYRIALIRTKKVVAYEDHIQPVCLPLTQELRNLKPSQYITTGWKSEPLPSYSLTGSLQKETVSAANSTGCNVDWNVPEYTVLCPRAAFNSTDSAFVGGPVGVYVNSFGMRFVQFAVLYSCDLQCQYYISADIVPFIGWIIANMRE